MVERQPVLPPGRQATSIRRGVKSADNHVISAASRELLEYACNPSKDGVSVWVAQGRRHQLSWVSTKPKGIPKLNSNDVYLILEQNHHCSVLGDRPFTIYKAFFWIGSRTLQHQIKIEKALAALDELLLAGESVQGDTTSVPKIDPSKKLRVWIEY